MALLKKHADAAAEAAFEHGEDELAEVRTRIIEKLERTRALDEADNCKKTLTPLAGVESPSPVTTGEGLVQTKGIDRVGVIAWALGRRPGPELRGE